MRLGIRGLLHALRKPFQHLPKKGGERRSARLRIRFRRRRRTKACLRSRRAPSLVSRTARDQNGGALALRRSTAVMRRRFDPPTGPGRASWNCRVQTGGPSPAPVQRAPRTPITRRRVRCPGRPGQGDEPQPREPHPPHQPASPVDVPDLGRLICHVTTQGTLVKGKRRAVTDFSAPRERGKGVHPGGKSRLRTPLIASLSRRVGHGRLGDAHRIGTGHALLKALLELALRGVLRILVCWLLRHGFQRRGWPGQARPRRGRRVG